MSWINDVRCELRALDTSVKSLRKFGLTVGIVFLLIAIWFYVRSMHSVLVYICGPLGFLLVLGGGVAPGVLKAVYQGWMCFAFVIGWVVSRIILSLLFFIVLFPLGLIARVCGKEFIDKNMNKMRGSYWVKKTGSIKYDKMY